MFYYNVTNVYNYLLNHKKFLQQWSVLKFYNENKMILATSKLKVITAEFSVRITKLCVRFKLAKRCGWVTTEMWTVGAGKLCKKKKIMVMCTALHSQSYIVVLSQLSCFIWKLWLDHDLSVFCVNNSRHAPSEIYMIMICRKINMHRKKCVCLIWHTQSSPRCYCLLSISLASNTNIKSRMLLWLTIFECLNFPVKTLFENEQDESMDWCTSLCPRVQE